MPLKVAQFLCLADNYGYLIRDDASGQVACIDTPDPDVIAAELDRRGWPLDFIFNTHWHADHTQGNAALKARTGAMIIGPEEVARVAPLDKVITPSDTVTLGEATFDIIAVGGHTLGHIAFHDPDNNVAFVGDAIFPLGCGRMFEGDADMMWQGLQRLAALPDDTLLYCGHEYGAGNARFALSVDTSDAVKARADDIFARRKRGEPTVPSTIGQEKATNPFLRAPNAEAFLTLRRAKDVF